MSFNLGQDSEAMFKIKFKFISTSKRLLGTPVSDEKVSVTKNDHFLRLCHEGHLGPTTKRDVEKTAKYT